MTVGKITIRKNPFLKKVIVSCAMLSVSVNEVWAADSTFPSTNITNPLSSDDFTTLITNFLQWLLGIAGGLALLMIIYGGVLYITSIGDQQKMETGKKVVTWTLFGLIIILASWSIIKVIDDIFVN